MCTAPLPLILPSADPAQDLNHVVDARWVARRGIYKDVVGTGAGRERADYQLRANFVVAMTVAPELFVPEHALSALAAYETHLVGPLGVRTLDPEDSDYRGAFLLFSRVTSQDTDARSFSLCRILRQREQLG